MTDTGGPPDGPWAVRVPVGYRIAGWTVTGGIASGSWGGVYDAVWADGPRPDGTPERVALKFLPTGTVTPRQFDHLRDMAAREVRFHRDVPHARLIRCFDIRTVDDPAHPDLDGAVLLVLERAERSLADLLRAGPVADAPRLVAEVCEGLAHMHARGWVHGDLKPGNVLLMADGSVRLADFGLTAEIEGTHGYLPPIGSSDYMPPERWTERLSERGMAIRPTADVWALGVTAYQLFTGALPFPGGSARARALAAAEQATAGAGPAFPSSVPPAWQGIIRDCLAPTHEARERHTAASILARIRALPAGDGPPGRAGGPARTAAGPLARLTTGGRVAVVAVALMLAAGLTAGLTFGVPLVRDTGDPDDTDRAAPPATPSGSAEFRPDLLRTGVGIPAEYRALIVVAGTMCKAPGLSPALVAAMLKVESDFDPDLSDPGRDEYGIARWTPRVLAHYLPEPRASPPPSPPFPPEVSIPAVGRFLCYLSTRLTGVPGDPALLLVAAYRTSAATVVAADGVPPNLREHVDRVAHYLREYQP